MILNQAVKFIRPEYALCSHSFTGQYKDSPKKEYEVGILFRERSLLVDKVKFFNSFFLNFYLDRRSFSKK